MMKYLLISDTHGNLEGLKKALEIEKPIYGLLHMGDVSGDQLEISGLAGQLTACAFVKGNCDGFFSPDPDSRDFSIGRHTIHMEHGHRLPDSMNSIAYKAESLGADILLFGHTHNPLVNHIGDLWVVNPGSLSRPRQSNRLPSYCVMEIDPEGEVEFEIKYLNSLY